MAEAVHVGLFITCLVDSFRPSIGFASIKLLEDAGCQVHVPIAQTCCGQTAWNCDDKLDTTEIAMQVIQNFESFEYIVVPSKPCAVMLRNNYPVAFEDNPEWAERAKIFSCKVYELTVFLKEIIKIEDLKSKLDKRADILVGDDLGSLMEIANNLKRQGITKEVRHVSEVLAGMTTGPSIGGR